MGRPHGKVGVNVGARRSRRVHEGDGGLGGLLRGHRPPARQQREHFLVDDDICSTRVRTPQEQPVDRLRVGQGQLLRDRAAHGDAEDRGAREPGSVQDGARIQGHPLHGIRPLGPVPVRPTPRLSNRTVVKCGVSHGSMRHHISLGYPSPMISSSGGPLPSTSKNKSAPSWLRTGMRPPDYRSPRRTSPAAHSTSSRTAPAAKLCWRQSRMKSFDGTAPLASPRRPLASAAGQGSARALMR